MPSDADAEVTPRAERGASPRQSVRYHRRGSSIGSVGELRFARIPALRGSTSRSRRGSRTRTMRRWHPHLIHLPTPSAVRGMPRRRQICWPRPVVCRSSSCSASFLARQPMHRSPSITNCERSGEPQKPRFPAVRMERAATSRELGSRGFANCPAAPPSFHGVATCRDRNGSQPDKRARLPARA